MSGDTQLRIITALVEHKPMALYRVSNMIGRKSFNVESITVAPAEVPGLARMTFTMLSDHERFDQVLKNLASLIDVRSIEPLDARNATVRELALVKFSIDHSKRRTEIMNLIETFHASIVDLSEDTLTVEISGDSDKVKAFVSLARNVGLKKVTRTGTVALARRLMNLSDE